MSEQTHTGPDGVKYRRIATRSLTPVTNAAAKEIVVDTATVEIVTSDSRLHSMGSQWGHVAIDINGIVHSRAHEEYVRVDKHTYFHGGTVALANRVVRTHGNLWRDNIGLVLRVSPKQKLVIRTELERRIAVDRAFKRKHPNSSTYSIFDNNCSSNVADVLETAGILAHDPRWLPTPVTPAEIDGVRQKSRRLTRRNYYPKQANE